MGHAKRLTYKDAVHHVTMRCNNKEFLFEEESKALFLDLLRETCLIYDCPLFDYCILTNHTHLLFQVKGDDVLSPFMHRLANVFARRFNAIHGRKGHLWEERFHSTIVDLESYLLPCLAYIDLNPVRAGMVSTPIGYAWSGHHHIINEDQSLITLHSIYLDLGPTRAARRARYREILAREAARKPYSLANVLFIGREQFVDDLVTRFGLVSTVRPRVRILQPADNICAVEPVEGGSIWRPDDPSNMLHLPMDPDAP